MRRMSVERQQVKGKTDRKAVARCWQLGLALLGLCVALVACSSGPRLYTIAILQFSSNELQDSTRAGFLQALEDAGYRDGVNVRYVYLNAQSDQPTAQLMAQRAAGEADLTIAISTFALQAALAEIKDKPIVFGAIADPIATGAGKSATDHLPNVTGASALAPVREVLALTQQVLPGVRRVGTIWDSSSANSEATMKVARQAAKDLGIEIVELTFSGSSEVLQAAEALTLKNIEAFFITSDQVVMDSFDAVVLTAERHKIPIIAPVPSLGPLGAAVASGWDYFANGYVSGQLVVRVIKGESPKDIPFQSLTKRLTIVNLAAAREQNFTVPPAVVQQADQVIK